MQSWPANDSCAAKWWPKKEFFGSGPAFGVYLRFDNHEKALAA
jgi:hypothetical protein